MAITERAPNKRVKLTGGVARSLSAISSAALRQPDETLLPTFDRVIAFFLGIVISSAWPVDLQAQRPESAHAADSAAVHAAALAIVAADNNRDLAGVLGHYAPDAVLLPPNESPVAGLEAIRPRYEALFATHDPAIEPSIDEIVLVGDLAYVRGRNGGVLRGRHGAADRALNDVYLMVLRRAANGQWHITRLMWHAMQPSAATPRLHH